MLERKKKKTPPRKPNDSEREYWREVKEEVESIEWDEGKLKQYIHIRLNLAQQGFKYTEENKALLNLLVKLTLEDSNAWVYVHGPCGSGKTTICREFARLWKFKRTTAHVLAEEIAPKHYQDEWYIDDLGAEREPRFAKNGADGVLGVFIEERYYREKRTMFTSNLSMNQLRDRYGERVVSRICAGHVVQLNGPDYRQVK